MKYNKIRKLLAISVITGTMLTTTGCNIKEIIDDFNPINNIPMPAYGVYEDNKYTEEPIEEVRSNNIDKVNNLM